MTQLVYHSTETAWCPGCGNFDIVATLTRVLDELQLPPHEVLLVGGIGQAAKLNQYVNANGFSGLHGRALPAAVAAKMVNQALTVIVNTGDGDSYGEGGNHFLHNIRRNVDITHFAHDNQIYGLTKGQTSPTSDSCSVDRTGACNLNRPFKPLLVALAAGATFAARTFSGNQEHMAKMMKAAILHKGYALVDILQPCVSFNKVNTFGYYKEHTYELEEGYDPTNLQTALLRSMEYGPKIPIGILYQAEAPTFHEQRDTIFDGVPMIDKTVPEAQLQALMHRFA
jgi:2-oxoglutarate/2-oxoacid ferredoxin oxidoreductase subunit beta